ncbi:MAG: hypothetical protein E6G51_02960 [Actinobacteria bacterium]|nr:MAG: hypothetical protein E6G51_02960 [Actinomycetota bacterium]
MKTLKRHLTVANVLSITAIFIALSATAVAATKLGAGQVKAVNIARQAVTNAKIKTQAVTSGKIKNGGVVNADLGAGAVSNSKIVNGAVGASKLAKEAVTSGALAKKAVTEAKLGAESVGTGKLDNEAVTSAKVSSTVWKQLVKNVQYVTETSANNSEDEKNVTASCPTGKEAIAGGARVNAPASVKVALNGDYPAVASNNARTGWIASGRETPEEAGNWQIVAYVICAEL